MSIETQPISNNQPAKVTLPQTITIAGQPVSIDTIPELSSYSQALRSQISQEEKSKLYSKISDLNTKLEELTKTAPTNTSVNIDDLAKVFDSFRSQIVEDVVSKVTSSLSEKMAPLEKESEWLRKQNIETYRAKLLSENQGKCLEDLIKGDSVEALDEALIYSKSLYSKLLAEGRLVAKQDPVVEVVNQPPTTPQATTPATPQAPTTEAPVQVAQQPQQQIVEVPIPIAPIPAPATTSATAQSVDLFKNISSMDVKTWAENRKSIKEGLKALLDKQPEKIF